METSRTKRVPLDLSLDGHRQRPSNDADDLADSDMFLELAKDGTYGIGGDDTVSRAGSNVGKLKVSHLASEHHQSPPLSGLPRKVTPTRRSPIARSFSNHRPSSSPIASNGYPHDFSGPIKSYHTFVPELRRVVTEDTNLSMRPFRPSYRPSNLSTLAYGFPRSDDSVQSSPSASPADLQTPITSCADGVESVGSATAVSTVWDEAEDLKNRIRQFRNGRRRITTGTIAEESEDRPQTATTMTTVSTTSHPLKRMTSGNAESVVCENRSHQLLETALRRVRDQVDVNVYRALASCASDAIRASSILDTDGRTSRADETMTQTLANHSSSDRRLRRKVDSLCQSLTELCIALSEGCDSQARSRQPSRAMVRRGPLSIDMNALESPSAIPLSPHSSLLSPRRTSNATDVDPGRPTFARTTSRTNTTPSLDDNSTDRATTVRAPSRAATEANISSPSSRRSPKKSSRDYTDHHPLPNTLPSSLRRTLATNHSNGSLNSAYTTMTYDNVRTSRYDLKGDLRNDPLSSSSLLEQRLARRRLQNSGASNRLIVDDESPHLSPGARPSERLRALSGSAQLPQSRGNTSSRYSDAREFSVA